MTATGMKLIAFHGDPKTPDDFIAEILKAGILRVDRERGLAYSSKWKGGIVPLGCKNQKGYAVCTLHFGGKRYQIKLHRLIWISANGPIPIGFMPDHKNRVKNDNRIDNLRLVTDKLNAANRRSYVGVGNPAARIDQQLANCIRLGHMRGFSYQRMADHYGVSKSLVAGICRGELWKS